MISLLMNLQGIDRLNQQYLATILSFNKFNDGLNDDNFVNENLVKDTGMFLLQDKLQHEEENVDYLDYYTIQMIKTYFIPQQLKVSVKLN